MENVKFESVYSLATLSEWLEENVAPDLVLCDAQGVTAAMLLKMVDQLWGRECDAAMDARERGEWD